MLDIAENDAHAIAETGAVIDIQKYRALPNPLDAGGVACATEIHDALSGKRYQIALGSCHEVMLGMLQDILDKEFDVVCASSFDDDLLQSVERFQPNVVLIDGQSSELARIRVRNQLRDAAPNIGLIYLTGKSRQFSEIEDFNTDPTIHIVQITSMEALIWSVRAVAEKRVHPAATLTNRTGEANCSTPTVRKLTPREQEVLALLVTGLSMKAVARQLGITARTVAFHKYHAMESLGLRDNSALIDFAVRHGMLGEIAAASPRNRQSRANTL